MLAAVVCEYEGRAGSIAAPANELVDAPEETWVEEPVDSDDEHTELREVLKQCTSTQEDVEAEDPTERQLVRPRAREAKAALDIVQDFVHEHSHTNLCLRGHVRHIEDMVKQFEMMLASARTVQTVITSHFSPAASRSAPCTAENTGN
jgi:hypothetical protein